MNEWIPVLAAFTGAIVAGLISFVAATIKLGNEERTEKRAIFLKNLKRPMKWLGQFDYRTEDHTQTSECFFWPTRQSKVKVWWTLTGCSC
ncbi:hypothetical protein TFLX_00301 [Thermoflexales bacterium]|nr:hypothetical protein TFLX_00301 [Thermoflexales bacterium]